MASAPRCCFPNRVARRSEGWRGIICERGDALVRVAFNDSPELDQDGTLYRIDASFDEAARQRQRQALDRAAAAKNDRLSELRSALLGLEKPKFTTTQDLEWLDSSLNSSQREAVELALSAKDLAVVHGPPGTGKTTTLVEVIRQAVRRGHKVLVCAPSNLAVDNLLERLLVYDEKAVRLGHPARVSPQLREHTLDLLVEDHPDVKQARKFARDAYLLFRQASKWTRAKPEPGLRRELRDGGKALLAEARRLEDRAIEQILNAAPILCATTTGLDPALLGSRRFDLLVLDEACQTTEPGCWVPLTRVDRVVLAGDHCQLPPTVISREAAQQGFGISLLERLVGLYGADVTRRLNVQYRMHERIMAFSSHEFYEDDLQADASVREHLLSGLTNVASEPFTQQPLRFLDTAGAGFDEETEPEGESRFNPQEAALAAKKVRELLDAGVRPDQIAVIAPYSAQVRRLRELLPVPGLEIDSVDGFQGREKEAVILSMVRSNTIGEIGFLSDVRRTNVALTRARRRMLIIGDSATLACDPFYQRLIEYCESVDAYGTVWEEGEG